MARLAERAYVAFPPRSGFLVLPRRPLRAARAGLALYEAVLPRQRLALSAGHTILGTPLVDLLPAGHRDAVDWDWWERLVGEVVVPHVGPVRHIALRVPANPRHSALMMSAEGRPVAFAKILGAETSTLSGQVWDLLGGAARDGFRVPALIATGSLDGVPYQITEPLPEGKHRPPPLDPARLRRIIRGFRAGLGPLPRPVGTPASYVPVHNDLTPRNLRVARDGTWWLFDLDRVRFGPPLVDELRFWCAWFGYRARPRVERDAERILELLRQQGSDADVIEAVGWSGRPSHTYRSIEDGLRVTVGQLATRQEART